MGYISSHTAFALLALWFWVSVLPALAQTRYVAVEESRLWIEGRSNVNRFECSANSYDLGALLYELVGAGDPATISKDQVSVDIRVFVDGFSCGKKRMDRDLRKALKAEQFPAIHFAFLRAERMPKSTHDDGARRLRTEGDLTIAGVTKKFESTYTAIAWQTVGCGCAVLRRCR
ncbi:MAG: YceI family protein [Candidatus Latescibacterota bacterium]|mgnify:CR=1 FL=1|jgi:hypothetical protein